MPGGPGPIKEGFHDAVVHGRTEAVRAREAMLRLRLRQRPQAKATRDAFADFDALVARRRAEADEFFAVLQEGIADRDACSDARATCTRTGSSRPMSGASTM